MAFWSRDHDGFARAYLGQSIDNDTRVLVNILDVLRGRDALAKVFFFVGIGVPRIELYGGVL